MAFPTSPTDGQIYKNYQWNSTNGMWNKAEKGLIQIVTSGIFSDDFNNVTTTLQKTNLFKSITPKYIDSIIKISLSATWLMQGPEMSYEIHRDSTKITGADMLEGDYGHNGIYTTHTYQFTDSPNTTSSIEYSVWMKCDINTTSSYIYRNQCITLEEIRL